MMLTFGLPGSHRASPRLLVQNCRPAAPRMSRILIIDDSPEDREWLADLAYKADYEEVICFDTVSEGVKHFRANPADVVLLDDWLGEQRGWAYAPSFQAIAPETRVVIVSGVPFPNVEVLSERLGVHFVVKEEVTALMLKGFL